MLVEVVLADEDCELVLEVIVVEPTELDVGHPELLLLPTVVAPVEVETGCPLDDEEEGQP